MASGLVPKMLNTLVFFLGLIVLDEEFVDCNNVITPFNFSCKLWLYSVYYILLNKKGEELMQKLVKIIGLMAIIFAFYFAFYLGTTIGNGYSLSAQPGTHNDPLVSRSYVNNRISELEAQIALLSAALLNLEAAGLPLDTAMPPVASGPAPQREVFEVVRAEAGTILVGGASTEIILRSGEATVLAAYNGLANVTTGVDVMNGQAVSLNHLLIVPQGDGRGLRFHAVSHVMVKGDYHFISG